MNTEVVVAQKSNFADGQCREVRVGKTSVLLIRRGDTFYAVGATCSHRGTSLSCACLSGHRLMCPRHQSVFDIRSGSVKEPPAFDGLPVFQVRVEGDEVIVSVPEESPVVRVHPMAKAVPSVDSRVFVIVGTGAAGNTAAETLRQLGFQGRLICVTKDKYMPYDTTCFSKNYLAREGMALPSMRNPRFYDDYDIELLREHEVVAVNTAEQTVQFRDRSSIGYGSLLLATGCISRRLNVPGEDLVNVFTLRDLDGCNALRQTAKRPLKIVCIGGGFISLESAACLSQHGLDTTVILPSGVPLQRVFGEQIGRRFMDLHRQRGVKFEVGNPVAALEGETKVRGVVLKDGKRLEANMVIVGVGVTPAAAHLKGMPLNKDGSIPVDSHLCVTGNVYAAGDMAQFPDWRSGERIRVEHWRTAQQLGRVAARNMVGGDAEFTDVPFFWSRQYDQTIQYVGHATAWDEILIDGSVAELDFTAMYIKDRKVLAVAGVHREKHMALIAEAMRTHRELSVDEVRNAIVEIPACVPMA